MEAKRTGTELLDLDVAEMAETNGGNAGDPMLWLLKLIRPGVVEPVEPVEPT